MSTNLRERDTICKELQLKLMLNPPDDVSVVYIVEQPDSFLREVYKCTCDGCLSNLGDCKIQLRVKFGGPEEYEEYLIGRDLMYGIRTKHISGLVGNYS